MKAIFLTLILILFLSLNSLGQPELYIPRNLKVAYEKGTRSPDGKSGAEYWQNFSEYRIEVEIDPASYLINGSEQITYYNNSPDTLKRMVLNLHVNVFKKGSARDYALVPDGVTDGVSIKQISIEEEQLDLENKSIFRESGTTAVIYLKKYIPPESSVNLSIDWSFNISSKATLRMGVYDSTTVFVGYWYPQIAVYDDIDGWDYNDYTGQHEFYNEFADFDVQITLPNNFGVWATGELQNPEEVLSKTIYNNYLSARESDTVINIITANHLKKFSVFNIEENKNIWRYKAVNIADFSFAFSDQLLWDGVRTVVDSLNQKNVFIQAVYPEDSPDFHSVAQISKDLIKYFSNEMPGIKYPFPSLVAFNNSRGGGGMEFPMMINDGSPEVWESTVSLTAHEIAHQYFPFFVGTNEEKYAFMDEGWAVMLPFKYMERLTGLNTRFINTVAGYEIMAGTEDDIPPIVPSIALPYQSYRNSAYDRSSIAYEILRDMLGDEIFLKAIQEYIKRWSGKHPIPYDFFFTFNNVTGKNLNWFWKPWFFENCYPDLAIDKVSAVKGMAEIKIKKIGIMPVPIKLKILFENESSEELYFTADVWQNGDDTFTTQIEHSNILKEVQLGDFRIPDSNKENNLFLIH